MLVVTFVVLGGLGVAVARGALEPSSWRFALLEWLTGVAIIGSTFVWCLMDSDENDYPFGKYLPIAFVAALPVALVVYFYRSKGVAGGSVAIAKAIGFAVFLFAIAAVSYLSTALLAQGLA
jgi:hypothetical protein